MNVNQPRKKAPHTRHFDKTMIPLEVHRAVMRLGLNNQATAALLRVSVGSVEELKHIGGALKADVIERVRVRLAELAAQKESA